MALECTDNSFSILPAPLADLRRQLELLRMEYEYEKEAYRRQAEKAGIYRSVSRGMCWYPVVVNGNRYNSLNQLVVEIERTAADDAEHNFEYGRTVCFFIPATDGSLRYLNFSAQISYVQENKMVVVLPGVAALSGLRNAVDLGVQLYFDETSYKTMIAALNEVMEAKEGHTARLREVLSGNMPLGRRELDPVRLPWLNASQEASVNKVLCCRDVAIVHGPPGTGKTTTLVEAVFETLHRENQVLVCAQSNTAVDWIAEKLTDRGINVLRVGNPTRVNDKMLAFTYERRFEAHPDYPELWSVRKAVRESFGRLKGKGGQDKDRVRNHLNRLKDRATELEIRINEQLFAEARVVACTLVSSAGKVLAHKRFSTLFIDEAACWIAITRADRVVLAGDHCQLPPTIKCVEAARGGLDKTLIQKVACRKPECVSMLKIQYRMREDIMQFPSDWFYHGELQAAPEVKYRGILEFDTSLVWVDTGECRSTETCTAEGTSRMNTEEADLLVMQLQAYIEKVGGERVLDESIDFGLISPYRAQIQYLRRRLSKMSFFKPYRRLITVHTVDGFQGQERDVIFISLVRANDEGKIGFLSDLRRMNVAITRARMKLVILGDVPTLVRHPFYRALYEYIQERGAIVTDVGAVQE